MLRTDLILNGAPGEEGLHPAPRPQAAVCSTSEYLIFIALYLGIFFLLFALIRDRLKRMTQTH